METNEFIEDVVLVANMQSIGPMFVSSSSDTITSEIGMLLAARLIITVGIGNQSARTRVLYGPMPVPEISDRELGCYLFTTDLQQQPLPDQTFSTGKGTQIFAVMFDHEISDQIHQYKDQIEEILKKYDNNIDYSKSVSGELSHDISDSAHKVLKNIHRELNDYLKLHEQYRGGSLFDIGFLTSIPPEIATVGKKIMQYPQGIRESEIEDRNSMNTLLSVGLIVRETRDGVNWLVPR